MNGMNKSLITLIYTTILLSYLRLSESSMDETPDVPMLTIAQCGYNCWPKYGIDGPKDLNVHTSHNQLNAPKLDHYQLGELRGCMEECIAGDSETEFYPSMDQTFVKDKLAAGTG